MKNFIQRSFRRELLVSFLAVSVLPLIVCCVFLIQMFKVKVGRDFEKKDMELAGAVEQVAFERFFDGLLTVEGDIVGVASVGQQQTRALQVAQRLVEPFVIKQAV